MEASHGKFGDLMRFVGMQCWWYHITPIQDTTWHDMHEFNMTWHTHGHRTCMNASELFEKAPP